MGKPNPETLTSHFLPLVLPETEANQKEAARPIRSSGLGNSQLGLFVCEDKGSDIAA